MLPVTALTQDDVDNCPVRNVLSQVTGKWQMLIVLALEDGPLRFGAMRRLLGNVTQRVLTENLRRMERDGYLSRTVHDGRQIAVSYALTDLGRELLEHVKGLTIWAATRHGEVTAARAQYEAV